MEKENKNNLICSGRVLTIEKYFEDNPQSVHVLDGNGKRALGVMLNGSVIEIGSSQWEMIRNTPIFHNIWFGEISIYKGNKNNNK